MPRRCGTGEPESCIGIAGQPRPQCKVRVSELILAGWDERPHPVDRKPDEPTEAAQLVDRGIDVPFALGVGQPFQDFLACDDGGEVA